MRTEIEHPELAGAGAGGGTIAVDDIEVAEQVKARGYWEGVWFRFRKDRVAIAGCVFVIVLILSAFIGGPIASRILGHGPNQPFNNVLPGIQAGVDGNTYYPVGPLTKIDNASKLGVDPSSPEAQGRDVAHPRRRRRAGAGHVPAHPVRRADLTRGGGAGDA